MEKTRTKPESPIATTTWAGYTIVDARELVKTTEFKEFSDFLKRHHSELIVDTGELKHASSPPAGTTSNPSIER